MGMKVKFELELPEELGELFASEEAAARAVKEALVLDLLNRGEISQGKAAELLGVDRWELFDLLRKHGLPVLDQSPEELRRDMEAIVAPKRSHVMCGRMGFH